MCLYHLHDYMIETRDAAETCQPRQPHNIQRLEVLRLDLIHPWCFATEELRSYLSYFGFGESYLPPPPPPPLQSQGCQSGWRTRTVLMLLAI